MRFKIRSLSTSLSAWQSLDPSKLSKAHPGTLYNLVGGEWTNSLEHWHLPDPLNGDPFLRMPDTQESELGPFVASLKNVPKSGMHNPLKHPERYNMYAEISHKAAVALDDPEVEDFFIKCIQRVVPKSRVQAYNEVAVSRTFLKSFAGDGVRFMARGFTVAGDHEGQESKGYRWPYGPVALIAPFNFPFEIPVLQLMGCLFMGNKPVVKGSEKTSMVLEQYIRLLHACGMPKDDVDLIHCFGPTMEALIKQAPIRLTQVCILRIDLLRFWVVVYMRYSLKDCICTVTAFYVALVHGQRNSG